MIIPHITLKPPIRSTITATTARVLAAPDRAADLSDALSH